MIMLWPSLRRGMQIAVAVVVLALTVPILAQAECVTVTLPKGERYTGPIPKPTLVFSGTVTATDIERYTVSFDIARVWRGQLRRKTTFFVAPMLEGAGVRSFQTGSAYLVTTYAPIGVFGPEDVAATGLLSGTVGISFGCIDGPVPLADASQEFKRLGPGRAPRP
jgi:hypothetical protein